MPRVGTRRSFHETPRPYSRFLPPFYHIWKHVLNAKHKNNRELGMLPERLKSPSASLNLCGAAQVGTGEGQGIRQTD